MDRTQTLVTAGNLISGERDEQHGDARESFDRIALLWSAYTDVLISPADVAAMMALLKVSRLQHAPKHTDSWIDLAGYAALGCELATAHSA